LATVCDNCKKVDYHFDAAKSAFIYEEPVVGLVLRLKYNAEADVASMVLPFLVDALPAAAPDIIVPVPLTPKRAKQRGYNQALLLANGLSKKLEIPVAEPLARVKETVAQKNMTLKQRQENLSNAFEVRDKSQVKGKCVLLVDDVLTTGTTASECAKVLKRAGAKKVFVLTIATTKYN
jgi:ComF family protein